MFDIDVRWIPLAASAIIGLPALTVLITTQLGYLRPRESARDRALRFAKEAEERRQVYLRTGIVLPDSEKWN